MQSLVKVSGLLLLIAASASAICSKGCPDIPEVNNTVLKIPQLTYVYAINYPNGTDGSKFLGRNSGSKLKDNVLTYINCTASYQTENQRLGEYANAQLVSWKYNDYNVYDSMASYMVYNEEKKCIDRYDELQNYEMSFTWKIVQSDEDSHAAAALMCYPVYPSDMETCTYEWILLGPDPNIVADARDDIISKLKDQGLDVDANLAVYSQDGCNH